MITDVMRPWRKQSRVLCRELGCGFILHTPERAYQFSAETEAERGEWMEAIDRVLKTQLLPQVLSFLLSDGCV